MLTSHHTTNFVLQEEQAPSEKNLRKNLHCSIAHAHVYVFKRCGLRLFLLHINLSSHKFFFHVTTGRAAFTYCHSDMIFQFFCSLFVVTRYDVDGCLNLGPSEIGYHVHMVDHSTRVGCSTFCCATPCCREPTSL